MQRKKKFMSRTQMIDGRDEGGNTDLMRAALNGQSETVKALLLSRADVNPRNREGRTAVMFAIHAYPSGGGAYIVAKKCRDQRELSRRSCATR